MNRLTKGAIAGAAGIALLIGGAGSFALWHADATVDAGVINSGQLKFASAPVAGTWTNVTPGAASTAVDLTTFKMVPGATLQYTQSLAISAVGTDLKALLSVDTAAFAGHEVGLAKYLDVNFVDGSLDNGATFKKVGYGLYEVTVKSGTTHVNAVVTANLPESLKDADGQNLELDLSALKFSLTQIPIRPTV